MYHWHPKCNSCGCLGSRRGADCKKWPGSTVSLDRVSSQCCQKQHIGLDGSRIWVGHFLLALVQSRAETPLLGSTDGSVSVSYSVEAIQGECMTLNSIWIWGAAHTSSSPLLLLNFCRFFSKYFSICSLPCPQALCRISTCFMSFIKSVFFLKHLLILHISVSWPGTIWWSLGTALQLFVSLLHFLW